MTSGRIGKHRWCRFDDPIFRARHYLLYGPHATARETAKAVMQRGEFDLIADVEFTADCFGRAIGRAAKNGERDPYLTVVHVAPHSTTLAACSTLVHEVGHAVDYVLSARGVKYEPFHSEPWRFYQEALYECGRRGLKL